VTTATSTPDARPRWSPRLRWLAAASVALLLAAAGWLTLWRAEPAPGPDIHAIVTNGIRLTDRLVQWLNADISPDGRLLAYCYPGKGIVVRTISGDSTWVIPGTTRAGSPVFSPDSRELVFNSNNTLFGWRVGGVAPVEITPMSQSRVWWGEDDRLYFPGQVDGTGIWRMPSGGGPTEKVTALRPGERAHVLPQLLPGGRTLIYTALGMSGGSRGSRIVAQRIGGHDPLTLVNDATHGRYLPSGHLLYARDDGTLYAIRFDPARLSTSGKAAVVQVGVGTATQLGEAFVDFSDTGTELYLERTARPPYVFTLSDRAGNATPFPDSAAMSLMGPVVFHGRISPDGSRVVFTGMRSGSADLWLATRAGEVERLTLDEAEDERAAWSPDGSSIAYTASPARIMVMDLSNAHKPRLVRRWSSHAHVFSWSPDGKWLLVQDQPSSTRLDLWAVSIDGRDSIAVANRPTLEWEGEFSPDGRWIAYFATEGATWQVYVVSFPDTSIRRQVTTTGGMRPHWGANGRELLYMGVGDGKLYSRSIDATRGLVIGPAREVTGIPIYDQFDVSRDGQQLLLRYPNGNDTTDYPPLHVRTNWFDHIRAKVD
jgi:serine/threonine-protein kinase